MIATLFFLISMLTALVAYSLLKLHRLTSRMDSIYDIVGDHLAEEKKPDESRTCTPAATIH